MKYYSKLHKSIILFSNIYLKKYGYIKVLYNRIFTITILYLNSYFNYEFKSIALFTFSGKRATSRTSLISFTK